MGANIGTSVTNTIVALGHSGNREHFKRAFSGATIHDMFNFLAVITLVPVEVASGYLYHLTKAIVDTMDLSEKNNKQDLLKKITKPFTNLFVQLDTKAITKIAKGTTAPVHLIKANCSGKFLFCDTGLSERATGGILLIISLLILIGALVIMVKLLQVLIGGRMAEVIRNTANSNLPGCWKPLTPYVAMVVGMGVTMLVQSSSVFTSTMTPLVAVDLITLEVMYPLTLGSNVGTTVTGVLAALASKGQPVQRAAAFQVSLDFSISLFVLSLA